MVSLHAFLRDYIQFNYSVPEIVERYVDWVSEVMYMILSRWNGSENEVFAVKCAKRGNDVYRSRVSRRFAGLCSRAEDLVFFNPKDRGAKKTRALWVTLTNDTKRCSFGEAWRNIGIEFNRFMAYVRKKFGNVSCCRVFESFENGYPHIHCILLFESTWFSVFRDRKGQFRVHSKKVIARGWHSNVDVKGMHSLAGGFSYQRKYLLKNIDAEKADSKALKTLALCWAYRKRAFSVSGRFRQLLHDLIRDMHNSNRQLRQATLTGGILVQDYKFYVLGFVPADVVRLNEDVWFEKLDSEEVKLVNEFLAGSMCTHI
ncbi:MAG: protein rep [Candidatus Bathyarchaeota archaeon]|nr:protein rep [Candidatus Bathyarchaeota archaeon]